MRDTVDMLPAILNLARKSKESTITVQDYIKEVNEYESKMSPRAFGWVKASGGSGELVGCREHWKHGKADPRADILLFVGRAEPGWYSRMAYCFCHFTCTGSSMGIRSCSQLLWIWAKGRCA